MHVMHRRRAASLISFVGALAISCGQPTPQPPTVTPPSGNETVNGTERLGWDQPAASPGDLSAIRYAVYVDSVRTEIADVRCADTATSAGFACTGRLPSMTPGSHTLELAAFVQDGSVLESSRSAPIRVTLAGVSPDTP